MLHKHLSDHYVRIGGWSSVVQRCSCQQQHFLHQQQLIRKLCRFTLHNFHHVGHWRCVNKFQKRIMHYVLGTSALCSSCKCSIDHLLVVPEYPNVLYSCCAWDREDFAEGTTCSCTLAGGILILHNNFNLYDIQLNNNSAYLGGAMYISADLSARANLTSLTFLSNTASLGAQSIYRT